HIYSARLDHAARLIERRALTKTGQPLSDIAYACGFRDYTHFARGFRKRFGSAPGSVGAGATGSDNARRPADLGQIERPTEGRDNRPVLSARGDPVTGGALEGVE